MSKQSFIYTDYLANACCWQGLLRNGDLLFVYCQTIGKIR